MPKIVKDIIRFVIFLGAGVGILAWIFSVQNRNYKAQCALDGVAEADCSLWQKLQADFLSADLSWLLLVLLAFMFSNLSRANRWQMLMRSTGMTVGFWNAFWAIMFGYMANLAVPRLGEVLRGTVVARYEKQPVEKVLGTIVVDRVVDVLSLLFAILLALVLEFDMIYGYLSSNFSDSRLAGPFIWILAAVALLGLFAIWKSRNRLKRTGLYKRFRDVLIGFADGLKSIRKVDNVPVFLGHTVFIWLMYFAMLIFCFKAFVPTEDLGLIPGLTTFVFGGLGIVFPSPGGMGTYHFMIMEALKIYGVAGYDAFSFANILYFSVQIFCNILFGALALVFLPLINRKKA